MSQLDDETTPTYLAMKAEIEKLIGFNVRLTMDVADLEAENERLKSELDRFYSDDGTHWYRKIKP